MNHFGPRFSLFLLILVAALTLDCGSSQSGSRTLQALTLNPPTADAGSFPGGQVLFTATGHYSGSPKIVTPITPAVWGACSEGVPTTDVSVSKAGVASCSEGASGTYTVYASDPTNCNVIGQCGAGCQITGTAKLTCP